MTFQPVWTKFDRVSAIQNLIPFTSLIVLAQGSKKIEACIFLVKNVSVLHNLQIKTYPFSFPLYIMIRVMVKFCLANLELDLRKEYVSHACNHKIWKRPHISLFSWCLIDCRPTLLQYSKWYLWNWEPNLDRIEIKVRTIDGTMKQISFLLISN